MNPYYIVDGQQRLTTAVILLVSIFRKLLKACYPEKKSLDTKSFRFASIL